LQKGHPDEFGELVEHYASVIDLAVEQRTFKVEHDLSSQLRSLAERLGMVRAAPRDVLEVHSVALNTKTHGAPSAKVHACSEEARFMLLELMGHLCAHYRKYSSSAGIMPAPPRPLPPPAPATKINRRRQQMNKYTLKLYITGHTARSETAITNLRRIFEGEFAGQYKLVVIDVLEQPQLAEDERILATPTLIKELPDPVRRIIGDLSDRDQVLLGLDLRPQSETQNEQGDRS